MDETSPNSTFTDDEVGKLLAWLQQSSCQQYLGHFLTNNITTSLLTELDTPALREIGINKLGDRLRLEIAIADLKSSQIKRRFPISRIRRINSRDKELIKPSESTLTANSTRQAPYGSGGLSKSVTFILPDGSTQKVKVDGCFSALLIKRKVLSKLGVRDDDSEYDTYVHVTLASGQKASLLYDVEFVTICFSPDRPEKHRIMLTPRNEQPTSIACDLSLRIIQRMAGRRKKEAPIKSFYGQRPPSELISSNLGEYFPSTAPTELRATIRNSVRYSKHLSKNLDAASQLLDHPSIFSEDWRTRVPGSQRTIGDVLMHNVVMVDEARSLMDDAKSSYLVNLTVDSANNPRSIQNRGYQSEEGDKERQSENHGSSTPLSKHRLSIATLFGMSFEANRYSRIELLNVDSDEDREDDDEYDSAYRSDDDEDFATNQKWIQGARIGSGSFGTVYLGMDPISGALMAVKQVPIPTGTSNNDVMNRAMIDALHQEMTLLKELNHENIVRYYGLSSGGNFLNIFLEYIPGGSLHLMLQLYGPFEEPLIRNFVRQVLVGLSYLHGVDIIHRDIKGANILIDTKGTAKISDFGISKKVDASTEDTEATSKQAKRASLQGLVYWMAPEVVKQTTYTKKSDIWSVGCLIIEMFTGKHPFPNFSQTQAIFKIGTNTKPQVPDWCTAEGRDFISKTFELDFEVRPNAVDLLTDPFLTPLVVHGARDN